MLEHISQTLKSGLQLIRVPMPAVKSVTVLLLCNTGSRYEEGKIEGIAHFLEHMVFKGTENFPTAQDLAQAVDGIGADFNAYTSKEYTGYYVQSSSKHLPLALHVVSDMIFTPKLRQEDIDREKGVIIEEMNMYADTPARHIGDLFEQMMFAGSGLSHEIIGSKETVTSFTTADFQAFLKKWYGPSNMILVVTGDAEVISTDAALAEIEKAFSKGTAERDSRPDVKNLWGEKALSSQQLLVHFKKTEQAHFILGFPGIKRTDPDRYAASLLATILGGNMSSRLFTEVREKRGLSYYVHADNDMYHDIGFFGASAGVDTKRVDEAITVILEELLAVLDKKPITAEELQKAKEYMAGKMVLGLEDSEDVAQYYGMYQLFYGEIRTPEAVLEKIRAVTLDDIKRIAERVLKPDQVRFGIIGPYEDEARFKTLLKLH